jgi:hypothetical protein
MPENLRAIWQKINLSNFTRSDCTNYLSWPRSRAGKNKIARNSAKAASKVIPRSRKGRDSNHKIGHRISAMIANGQQTTNNNNQQINVSISFPINNWIQTVY